jgi:hypothetical protein
MRGRCAVLAALRRIVVGVGHFGTVLQISILSLLNATPMKGTIASFTYLSTLDEHNHRDHETFSPF